MLLNLGLPVINWDDRTEAPTRREPHGAVMPRAGGCGQSQCLQLPKASVPHCGWRHWKIHSRYLSSLRRFK